jgi:hypothetical protein
MGVKAASTAALDNAVDIRTLHANQCTTRAMKSALAQLLDSDPVVVGGEEE